MVVVAVVVVIVVLLLLLVLLLRLCYWTSAFSRVQVLVCVFEDGLEPKFRVFRVSLVWGLRVSELRALGCGVEACRWVLRFSLLKPRVEPPPPKT